MFEVEFKTYGEMIVYEAITRALDIDAFSLSRHFRPLEALRPHLHANHPLLHWCIFHISDISF